MTKQEQCQAADALCLWFKSQDIPPFDAIPVMAIAINIACLSVAKGRNVKLTEAVSHSEQASKLVLEVMKDFLDGNMPSIKE